MDLKTYFFSLDAEGRDAFASKCGTTRGHMQNVAYGYREPSTELAVAIERESVGSVRRQDLFPDSFTAKWPELAEAKAA
jgi:DNA-binding transcriptional regulator YdaS (Cro superfamily)